MSVVCNSLHESRQRAEERCEREIVTVTAQVDGGLGELGHERVGGGDQVVEQLLVLLAGWRAVETAHYVLFELGTLGQLFRADNCPLDFQIMGTI
jgi:hypothetical protein